MNYRVPRMTAEESALWTGLMRVVELLPAALDAQLQRDAQMTHFEFIVLSNLQLADESHAQMRDLAHATNATLPRLSRVCARLEERGFVKRAPSPTDGRATLVTLTKAGRAALIRAVPGHVATAHALVIDALTPPQLEALGTAANVIGRRLDPDQRFVWIDDDARPGSV
ncbi:MarR family transcriptional regulator [Demequina sp.]|uniref:MarR family winged helix-turn-helix transcriptional regulator n=1 Tax=Demequina sp. TaxID=2050685 RepID=UPI0025B9A02D|nr:MarR family transcriptional regulator [Demequina sp.]